LRDSNGNEVDLVIEQGMKLTPVEIKSGQTVARDFFAGLRKWMELCGDQAVNPVLIYGGERTWRQQDVTVADWRHAAGSLANF